MLISLSQNDFRTHFVCIIDFNVWYTCTLCEYKIIINVNVLCSTNLSSCLSSSESIQHCSQVLLSPISVLQSCHHHGHLICFRAISSRLASHVLRSERMEGEGDR